MTAPNLTRLLLDAHLDAGRGEAIAIREPRLAWSYARLAGEAGRRGVAFASRGVQPGDRVALLMHDSAEMAAAFLGAARIGALPVPVGKLLRAPDVRAVLADARPKLVVAHRDLAPVLDEVCDELPEPPEVLEVDLGGQPGGRRGDLLAVIAQQAPSCPPYDSEGGDAPAMLLYSSGAGGAPKGVPHTAEAVRAAYEAWVPATLALSPEDRVFSTAALSTSFGLATGLLFPLLAGATACLLPGRIRPPTIFEALPGFQPTVFVATPSLWAQMISDFHAATAPRPSYFRGVRAAVSGAEPLPSRLYDRVKASFGVPLLHGFGSTEALNFFLAFPPDAARPGAAGRLLPGYEARILDEQELPVGPQEIGVLELRGPSVAPSYWRGVAAESFRPGGWLRTADRFFVDADGWYFHCGRSDDVFRVSGKYVSPVEVEDTLLAHAAVWECAVVGHEDGDGITVPVAFVVPNVGVAPTPELGRDLMEFVKRQIAPYKFPRKVEFVTELPKNAQGRLQRWKLPRAPVA